MIAASGRAGGRVAALTASLVVLVLGVAAPAHAQTPEEHCVVLIGDEVEAVVCGATPEEADAAFTAETGLTRVESSDAQGARLAFSLATLYADAGYGGSSYTLTRPTACDGVTLTSLSALSTVGLNDAVSSFQTYSPCTVRLYADAGFGGATYGYTTSQSSLPTFNDTASSARAR